MADCSGYGIGVRFFLCVDGAVGNGKKANLTISISNQGRYSYDTSSPITVPNWDGSALSVNLDNLLTYGFSNANCDIKTTLKIKPDGGSNSGTLLLEHVLTNCGPATTSYYPQVFENCGGVGPHVISEMSTFSLEFVGCDG
ncbi:hypothetical protein GCM10008090_30450 [Arenicella chitinivorans]|uniref:Uncharacterized protein n=1 Tax=Arenicella chitinivorans TaxID=1329800 RepID=A0A918RZW0_9GAMM|nr:hypothetical protein [Arenicella chitinivorans]GHA18752.1 hypothetical protein GCM10008090_30450 [Arenicella chitinivorans]